MFNILTDKLPDSVTEDGEKCFLKTDFKNWITFEVTVTDPRLTEEEKLMAILPVCFKRLPSTPDVAVKACVKFYSGEKKAGQKGETGSFRPLYSFLYDSELIYSSFMTQYGIDLSCADMHWFKFKALFKGLKADSKISEVMHIRGMNLSEIKDEEMRRKYRELKKIWTLPDFRSEREKAEEFVRAVEGLF